MVYTGYMHHFVIHTYQERTFRRI